MENDTTIQYCRIPFHIMGNLNIASDIVNPNIVLWSKYELLTFEPNLKQRLMEFEIEQVLINEDLFLCLDYSGSINLCEKESFKICNKQNIKCVSACEIDSLQYVVSLQFEQDKVKLFVNKFDIDFIPRIELDLNITNEDWKTPEVGKCIMISRLIKPEYLKKLKDTFNLEKSVSNYLLVIVSLDKRNVYAIFIPVPPLTEANISEVEMQKPIWVKLHNSLTDVVDITIKMIDDIHIFLVLAAGNIIRIPLLLRNQKPEIFHLNTAVNKIAMVGETIIYSDGLTMWKTDNVFSKLDVTFEQYIVRNVRDLCVIEDRVCCVTYTNVIYTFGIHHNSAMAPDIDYSYPVQLITNSDYLVETLKIFEKNKEVIAKINKETEYLMALSLSNRHDIINDVIQVEASVFDDYKHLAQNYPDHILTDEFNDYCDSQAYYFLIQFSVAKVQHKLNNMLSQVLGDVKIHITLLEQEVLKTTSIQIEEQLRTKNYVVSLKTNNKNIKRIQVLVKIVANVPGKYDDRQRQWIIIYRKCIHLYSENFISTKQSVKNITLKESELPLDTLICKIAEHLHGSLYRYVLNNRRFEWTFYIKLPSNSNFHTGNIFQLIHQFDSKRKERFHKYNMIKDKNWLQFQIGKESVNLNIEGDKIKVSCPDVIIALDIRNYFSGLIFKSLKCKSATLFIDHKLYTTIENLRTEISTFRKRRSTEDFAILLTRFLNIVYCSIPI